MSTLYEKGIIYLFISEYKDSIDNYVYPKDVIKKIKKVQNRSKPDFRKNMPSKRGRNRFR